MQGRGRTGDGSHPARPAILIAAEVGAPPRVAILFRTFKPVFSGASLLRMGRWEELTSLESDARVDVATRWPQPSFLPRLHHAPLKPRPALDKGGASESHRTLMRDASLVPLVVSSVKGLSFCKSSGTNRQPAIHDKYNRCAETGAFQRTATPASDGVRVCVCVCRQ